MEEIDQSTVEIDKRLASNRKLAENSAASRWLPNCSRISATVRRRLENGFRTAYTGLICLVVIRYWNFAILLTFVTPVLSSISAVLYVGLWVENFWKVTYSTVIGSAVGLAVGAAWEYKPLQIVLLFISLVWVNRMSYWDRIGKIIGGLCLLLTALFPTIVHGAFVGLPLYKATVAMVAIPYLITFVTLIFPFPAFSFKSAQVLTASICRKLSTVIFALTSAFSTLESVDIYNTQVDHLLSEIETDLVVLAGLSGVATYETALFCSKSPLPGAVKAFVATSRKLVHQMRAIREMYGSITMNQTQAKFAEKLALPLHEMSSEIELALSTISNFISNCHLSPLWLRSMWSTFAFLQSVSGEMNTAKDVEWTLGTTRRRTRTRAGSAVTNQSQELNRQTTMENMDAPTNGVELRGNPVYVNLETGESVEPTDNNSSGKPKSGSWRGAREQRDETFATLRMDYEGAMARLSVAIDHLLTAYHDTRIHYVWRPVTPSHPATKHANNSYSNHDWSSPYPSDHTVDDSELPLLYENVYNADNPISQTNQRDEYGLEEDALVAAAVREEGIRLSIRNLGPRGAVLHRMLLLADLVKQDTAIILNFKGSRTNLVQTVMTITKETAQYVYACCIEGYTTVRLIYLIISGCCSQWNSSNSAMPPTPSSSVKSANNSSKKLHSDYIAQLNKILFPYIQPAKISAAITLTSLFVILDELSKGDLARNGLWATVVIALIRQDSTSSSFLVGYQRLEGTVVGALYAFGTYQLFNCGNQINAINSESAPQHTCGFEVTTPVLIIWLGVCAFFKEGPRHGYAASVAGFTPIILFLGISTGMEAAWRRVSMTFLGIAIYLVIDNVIFPQRTDSAVRSRVLESLSKTIEMFHQIVVAIHELLPESEEFHQSTSSSHIDNDVHSNAMSTSSSGAALSKPLELELANNDFSISEINNGIPAEGDGSSLMDELNELSIPAGEPLNTISSSCEKDSSSNNVVGGNSRRNSRDKNSIVNNNKDHNKNDNSVIINDRPVSIHIHNGSKCDQTIADGGKSLEALNGLLAQQSVILQLGTLEPELWNKSFPLESYSVLLLAFKEVVNSGRSVFLATKALNAALESKKLDPNAHISIQQDLRVVHYMSDHLLEISSKAEIALNQTKTSLVQLYNSNMVDIDMSALVKLARKCDRLLVRVDEYFRTTYTKAERLRILDPLFLIIFQDLFESVLTLVKSLSGLGRALLIIKNVEVMNNS